MRAPTARLTYDVSANPLGDTKDRRQLETRIVLESGQRACWFDVDHL